MHSLGTKTLRRGFTLIEIMFVVITLGVIASLALVNYNRVVEQGYCRNAQQNLLTIHSAHEIYRLKGGLNIASANLASINSVLNISLPPDPRFNYTTTGTAGPYLARATKNSAPNYNCWILFSDSPSPTNPSCSDGTFCSPIIAE